VIGEGDLFLATRLGAGAIAMVEAPELASFNERRLRISGRP